MRLIASTVLAYGVFASMVIAQIPDAMPRHSGFEVASIRLNRSSDGLVGFKVGSGGRFTLANSPLQILITLAYSIKMFQLRGAPSWLMSERYDIEAKAEGNPGREEMIPMIQALLEDRLQLKFHRETKEMPVYALVVAKPGKLQPSDGECTQPPPPKPGEMLSVRCGTVMIFPGRIIGKSAPLTRLIDTLSRSTERMVLDQTNLTGKYDINLEWSIDQARLHAGGATPGLPDLQAEPSGPSLFNALQEHLGLKLESQKGPVEMFVIDHVERPSAN